MNRRAFVTATAVGAAATPLTAPQASTAPDPAIAAVQALKEAEQRFNGLGLNAAAAEYDKAYDRAISTKPTTPAGAAALLSIIDTDEPFIPSIIAGLEGMADG